MALTKAQLVFRERANVLLKHNLKRCSKCTEIKNTTEFNTDNSNVDKLHNNCRACRNTYLATIRPRYKEKAREYIINNAARIKEVKNRYRCLNKDKIALQVKNYNGKHKELTKQCSDIKA